MGERVSSVGLQRSVQVCRAPRVIVTNVWWLSPFPVLIPLVLQEGPGPKSFTSRPPVVGDRLHTKESKTGAGPSLRDPHPGTPQTTVVFGFTPAVRDRNWCVLLTTLEPPDPCSLQWLHFGLLPRVRLTSYLLLLQNLRQFQDNHWLCPIWQYWLCPKSVPSNYDR